MRRKERKRERVRERDVEREWKLEANFKNPTGPILVYFFHEFIQKLTFGYFQDKIIIYFKEGREETVK